MRGIRIGALPPETPSVTRHVQHPNNFTPPGLTLSVSGAAPGFSIMGRKVLFVSRSTASVLRQLFGCITEYTNTASRVRLLSWCILFCSLSPCRKISLASLGFIALHLQSGPHSSHWWLIFGDIGGTKTVWVPTLVKDRHRRSMWINISHSPGAFEIRDGVWGGEGEEKSTGKINWLRALRKRSWWRWRGGRGTGPVKLDD